MTKRMLIDASHAEETRVVVLDGNRLDEFDIETENKRPLKGNIYLAKVVRVEPSLQAAFVEYGGNRHGFLAFGEIHPDYYQIPQADRDRLAAMQAAEAQDDEDDDGEEVSEAEADAMVAAIEAMADADAAERPPTPEPFAHHIGDAPHVPEAHPSSFSESFEPAHPRAPGQDAAPVPMVAATEATPEPAAPEPATPESATPEPAAPEQPAEAPADLTAGHAAGSQAAQGTPSADQPGVEAPQNLGEPGPEAPEVPSAPNRAQPMTVAQDSRSASPEELLALEAAAAEATVAHDGEPVGDDSDGPAPESIGGRDTGEADEAVRERRIPSRFMRHYKIQDVIRRRQIMLVQVVKEERGNKGAALTTYISLAGRFSVLMPNSPRGGGISRKITSANDRKRLREVIQELRMPRGMSLIVRTAGASRPKPEIRRDCEYLLRLWDDIRDRTMESMAPSLVYEEADLIKRSIRDVFGRDIEEIQVEGEDAFRQAREFMGMLMPQGERKIRLYKDPAVPLFARYGVDQQLDAMMSPTVQLKSGGYIVINQTEALVAIDVNSGRATRDRHIEDTALRTNCEAAEEIARQLRLRDLAGLIVIDFIDMEASRNDAMVERRLKEALKDDRARIQVGRISHFGLLEMSRQRLRPSLTEHSFITCPHCQGIGIVRSAESSALQVLRQIEEEGVRRRAAEIVVHLAPDLALHILNRRRDRLQEIEARYGMTVLFEPDASLLPPAIRIDRTRAPLVAEAVSAAPAALRMDYAPEPAPVARAAEPVVATPAVATPVVAPGSEHPAEAGATTPENGDAANGENRRRRRRRRRRGGRREDGTQMSPAEIAAADAADAAEDAAEEAAEAAAAATPVVDAVPSADQPQDAAADGAPDAGPEGEDDDQRPRRRGRRGGRRRREDGVVEPREPQAPQPAPRYAGPTPADPFAGTLEDIFDVMAAAEEAAQAAAGAAALTPPVPVARVPVTVPITPAAPPAIGEAEAVLAPVEPVPEVAPVLPEAKEEAAPAAAPEPAPEPAPGPVAEAAEPVAAPRRATRGRRSPAAAVAVEPATEAAPAAPAEAEAPPAAKPSRARSPRTAKARAATPAAEGVVTEAPAEPVAEVAPAKPRRSTRSRAAAAPVEAPVEPVAVEAVLAAETPAPSEAPVVSPAAAPAVDPAPASTEPVAAPPVQPVLVEAATDAPKKRGWWKR
jgi:ribonuclease E